MSNRKKNEGTTHSKNRRSMCCLKAPLAILLAFTLALYGVPMVAFANLIGGGSEAGGSTAAPDLTIGPPILNATSEDSGLPAANEEEPDLGNDLEMTVSSKGANNTFLTDLERDGDVYLYNLQDDVERTWTIGIPAAMYGHGGLTVTASLPQYGMAFVDNLIDDLNLQTQIGSAVFVKDANKNNTAVTIELVEPEKPDDYFLALGTKYVALTNAQCADAIENGWRNSEAIFKVESADGQVTSSYAFTMRPENGIIPSLSGTGCKTTGNYSDKSMLNHETLANGSTGGSQMTYSFPVIGDKSSELIRIDELRIYVPGEEFSVVGSGNYNNKLITLNNSYRLDSIAKTDETGTYFAYKPTETIYNNGLYRNVGRADTTTIGYIVWQVSESLEGAKTYKSPDAALVYTTVGGAQRIVSIQDTSFTFETAGSRIADTFYAWGGSEYDLYTEADGSKTSKFEVVPGQSYKQPDKVYPNSFARMRNWTYKSNGNEIRAVEGPITETYTFPYEIQPTQWSARLSGEGWATITTVKYTILRANGTEETYSQELNTTISQWSSHPRIDLSAKIGEGDRVVKLSVNYNDMRNRMYGTTFRTESIYNYTVPADAQKGVVHVDYSVTRKSENPQFEDKTFTFGKDSQSIWIKIADPKCMWTVSDTSSAGSLWKAYHTDDNEYYYGSAYLYGEPGSRTSVENPVLSLVATCNRVGQLPKMDDINSLVSGRMSVRPALAGFTLTYVTTTDGVEFKTRTHHIPENLTANYELNRLLLDIADNERITKFEFSKQGLWDYSAWMTKVASNNYDKMPLFDNIYAKVWETNYAGEDILAAGTYSSGVYDRIYLGVRYSHADECNRVSKGHQQTGEVGSWGDGHNVVSRHTSSATVSISGSAPAKKSQNSTAEVKVSLPIAYNSLNSHSESAWEQEQHFDVPESIYIELTDTQFELDLSNAAFKASLAAHGISTDDVEVIEVNGRRFLHLSTGDKVVRDVKLVSRSGTLDRSITVAFNIWSGAEIGNHSPIGEVYYDLHDLSVKYDGSKNAGYAAWRLDGTVLDELNLSGDPTTKMWRGNLSNVQVEVVINQNVGTIVHPGKDGFLALNEDRTLTFRAVSANSLMASTSIHMPDASVGNYTWIEKLPTKGEEDESGHIAEYTLLLTGPAYTYNNSLVNAEGVPEVSYSYSKTGKEGSFVSEGEVTDWASYRYISGCVSKSTGLGSLETRYPLSAIDKDLTGSKLAEVTGYYRYLMLETNKLESDYPAPVKYIYDDSEYAIEVFYQDANSGTYGDEADIKYDPVYGTAPEIAEITDEAIATYAAKKAQDGVYVLDSSRENRLAGAISELNDLVLRVFLKLQYVVTFNPGEHAKVDSESVSNTVDWGATTASLAPTYEAAAGYRFVGWDKDFAPSVNSDAVYTAQWEPRDDTSYKVEIYYQGENGTYASTADFVDTRKATTATTVSVTDADKVPDRARSGAAEGSDGCVLDSSRDSEWSGVVAGDGSLVLKVYFKRQFSVSYEPGDHGAFTGSSAADGTSFSGLSYGDGTPAFAGKASASGDPAGQLGYRFTGWTPSVAPTVTDNAAYQAVWAPRNDTAYAVEFYYQRGDGAYPALPDVVDARQSETGSTAFIALADRLPGSAVEAPATAVGYALDTARADAWEGAVAADGSLVLRVFYKLQFSVVYDDGVDGSAFAERVFSGLGYGDATPAFAGNPERPGYVFKGWSPEVSARVTSNARYVAQWEAEPVVPAVDEPEAGSEPEPEPDPEPTDTPATTTTTTTTTATTAVPAAAPGAVAPAAAALAAVAPAAAAPAPAPATAPAGEAIDDEGNPLGEGESIEDDANPLAAARECWVHWWIALGILLTVAYTAVVAARRQKGSSDLQRLDDSAMGADGPAPEPDGPLPSARPATA